MRNRPLPVAALGTFVALVAFTIPIGALNPVAATLGAGPAGRTWILSSMSIGLAAALLSAGTLSDDFGRRRTFVAGLLLLTVASVVCGLAQGPLEFVLARVGQGVGGAAVVASSLGVIAAGFPAGPRRAAASGVWGASLGAGIAGGPLVGALLDLAVSWRASYAVLALACLATAGLALLLVPESRADHRQRLDVPGVLSLGLGMGALLAALTEGRQDWTSPATLTLGVLAVVLLAGFVAVERRSHGPMLDLALFAHPPFAAATLAAFATGAGIITLMSLVAAFVGQAYAVSTLGGAVLLLVWSGTSVVTALLARRVPPTVPGRVQLGVSLLGVTLGQLMTLGADARSGWPHFVPGMLVAGVASGFLNAALGREAVASVPDGRGSVGSGANNTARYVGSALGVTVVSLVATGSATGAGLAAGWNHGVLVTAGVSLVGGLLVLGTRERRRLAV